MRKKLAGGLVAFGALAGSAAYFGHDAIPMAVDFVDNGLNDLPPKSLPDEVSTARNSLFVCFDGFDFENCNPSNSLMYMSTGGNRIEMPYDHFDKDLPLAVMNIEDNHFLDDLGPLELARKARAFYEGRGSSGVREQVARTSYVDNVPEGETEVCLPLIDWCRIVPARKAWEWDMARVMQDEQAPEETMQDYLNDVYLGCGAYGFEQASISYFGKSANDLSLSEAYFLAGLAQSPSAYDGVDSDGKGGEAENEAELVAATNRRNEGLDNALEPVTWFDGTKVALTPGQVAAAKAEPRGFDRCTPPNTAPVAHYEVANALGARHALNQIELDLINNTGMDFQTLAANTDGPVYVLSTINYDVQAAINSAINNADYPRDGREAAVAAVTTHGAVAGLYGGPYSQEQQVNLAIEPTVSGSAFKWVVLAEAMEAGIITNIDDPNQVPDEVLPMVWEKGNGDGTDWVVNTGAHCDVATECTIREALAKSSNPIFLQILENQGPDGLIAVDILADKLGITSETPPQPSMVTGAREASMIDLTTAQFQAIGNDGKSVERHYVNEVWQVLSDKDNNIYCWKCNAAGETEIIKLDSSNMLLDTMRSTITMPGGTANNTLGPIASLTDMAGKTGTHDDNKIAGFYGTFCVMQSENMSIGVIIRYPNELSSLGDNYTGGKDPAEIWGAAVQNIKAHDGNKEYCQING